MKKRTLFTPTVILALSILLSACSPVGNETAETEYDTATETVSNIVSTTESTAEETQCTTEAETEILPAPEIYTDLSGNFSPLAAGSNAKKASATAEGAAFNGSVELCFDGKEENYSLSSFGISGLHDINSCKKCNYKEKNGSAALHICDDSGAHSGVTVILKTPINASLVSSIKMTLMTKDEIKNSSQIRIQNASATNASDVINLDGCPNISGAVSDWKTIDFGFSSAHINTLADSDGYIHALKFYFRDKDATEAYIQKITFNLSISKLCTITALNENTFSSGNALSAIADKIARNLSTDGIGAEIELRCSDYVPSTTSSNGSITYKVIISPTSGKQITINSVTTALRKTQGVWIPQNSDIYGTQSDAAKQWETGFDKSGVLCLENNLLKSQKGLVTVQYAVIPEDADLTDSNIEWFSPQLLELNENGIEKLYINAFLDYGHRLTEGESYRFVVRGVIEGNNYILHLDIPFEYAPLSTVAADALSGAIAAVSDIELLCDNSTENKEAFLKSAIEDLINNQNVAVEVKTLNQGINSGIYKALFSYNAGVTAPRLSSYTLSGEQRNDFFAYNGTFFTHTFSVVYDLDTSYDITLCEPFDGKTDVRIASADVVDFMNIDSDILVSPIFNYNKTGELCDPIPVQLKWDSKLGGTYTVKISEHSDLSDPWMFTTDECTYDIYNLKADTKYYWTVERGDCVSEIFTFVTEAGYPRYILSDKVSNFRDIGGLVTVDGKKVKQGMAFRFSNFDSLSAADKEFINNCLAIRTELDLRGEKSTSTLGSHVQAIPISIKWYSGIFPEEQKEPTRQAIAVFGNADNYPIGYHCAIGRDRTGTVTILLYALLGVDEDAILRDYMISRLSVSGRGSESTQALYNNYVSLIKGLNEFGSPEDTLQRKVELYLLSIGITHEEINTIREVLLED